ncbi:MAG: CheA kinase [Alphaproteobacteria bacterium]|jgi:two-component system chemotaxis sensor kinase CheA|nr:CheA kinase [Alphaproteobacteria bacterium]
MDDIISEFLAETHEGLVELDNALVLFERNPGDDELLSKIFRVFHTIKGSCGFIGLERLGTLAHRAEDILDLVRERKLAITPDFITALLGAVDRIKTLSTTLEKTGQEPQGSDEDILSLMNDVAGPAYQKETGSSFGSGETADAETDGTVDESDRAWSSAAGDFSTAAKPEEGRKSSTEGTGTQQTLRVNVDLLESMMTVVSELVLTRNQLLQTARTTKNIAFNTPLQRLNQVVSELQESVMKTRMQPIGNAWSTMPRIVRDVCNELGKKIDLEMRGQDTELDRQVLEMIKDPLMHMVRNAADHGIEDPADRRKSGKAETGHILLNAYHQGGHIIIQISDDGRGLPLQKIKGKALQAGLATQEQLNKLSPQQIQQFIFRPGFSTADRVTSVSGRGVGMDVVRTNIQKIGGTVEMTSTEGKGMTFTINIPLTLAIVSALIIEVAGARFAFPQLAVSELVMVGKGTGMEIETVNGTPVMRLRETLLPLIYLGDYLKVWDKRKEHAHHDGDMRYVVVTRAAGIPFGLVVDHVLDMEEIVVKPTAQNLKEVRIFSGNTILGDGSVIMILDPSELLQAANLREDIAHHHLADDKHLLETTAEENLLLLFKAGDKTPKAAPLKMVSRLREIRTMDIELSNGRPVLQHLGRLMPIFSYDEAPLRGENAFLIIFEHDGQHFGLLVDQVLDIAKYNGSLAASSEDMLLDTIILNQQSTDVVNPLWYVSSATAAAGK